MQITISALAAQLGELEPVDRDEDSTREHHRRQDIVFAAARSLPVVTPKDASLALCAIASRLVIVLASEVTDGERNAAMEYAVDVAARIALWLRDYHGVQPLTTMWPPTDPLVAEQEATS